MQMCPSWPKEHDWKSCKRLKPFPGFKSLHLRQKGKSTGGCFFLFSIIKKQGFETRFQILRPKAEKIWEKGPVDLSITNREPCCSHQKIKPHFCVALFFYNLLCFLYFSNVFNFEFINRKYHLYIY